MSVYTLTQIFIYPVKSLPGISLERSTVEERGLKYDRRWMLVDKDYKFITQRFHPQMVFIKVKIDEENLSFNHNTKSSIKISLNEFPTTAANVQIWDDHCEAYVYDEEVNHWFSEAVDTDCKLVYMPNSTQRKTSTKYYTESKDVSFADGYPYLIIGESSLGHLNSKLDKHVKMIQFRPNLVFSGGNEHEEDDWRKIKIGNLDFAVVKPCARCVITTIDTSNGKKNKEPLATLSRYRNFSNKIMFGQNAIALSEGIIKVGDKITLL